jgi:serine O-acetyltransferase
MDNGCRIARFADVTTWLTRDLVQRGVIRPSGAISAAVLLRDPINWFMFLLRMKEWTVNCAVFPLLRFIVAILFRRQSIRLGFSIPPNVFGPGLAIVHYGPIVVNGNARVGENCRIHVCVNIGGSGELVDESSARGLAPIIGRNVYIAPGVKIFGPIRIADGCAIGANAVVGRSFVTPNVTIAGIPARVISDKGSSNMILGR